MVYDDESKPWVSFIDFLAQHDDKERIRVRIFAEGKLRNGSEVFVTVPEDLMMSFMESFADRLRMPRV